MYKLNTSINTDSAFLINRSLIESRLEPKFYTKKYIDNFLKIQGSKLPVFNLSEVTDLISDGTHFKPVYVNEGVKFISVKDVRKSKIDLNKSKFISKEDADKLDRRCKPKLGDVLLTKIGATYGYAATVETEQRFQIFVSLALLRPNHKIIGKYLEIFLNSELAYVQFERVIKGAGVPDLHLEDIRKIKIPLPSIEKQKLIVSLYNEAFNEKQQKEKELKKLQKSIDSYLLNELGIKMPIKETSLKNRIFNVSFSEFSGDRFDSEYSRSYFREINSALLKGKFKVSKLKNIALFIESGSRPKGGVGQIRKGIFSIGGEHVNNKCEVGNGRPKYISIHFHEKIKQTETKMNDIILVKDGATTGKVGIIDSVDFVGQNINEHVFLIRTDETLMSSHFLVYYLYSSLGQILLKRFITGATVTGLTKDSLRKILIPLPSLSTQKNIIDYIFEIRTEMKLLESKANLVLKTVNYKIENMILG